MKRRSKRGPSPQLGSQAAPPVSHLQPVELLVMAAVLLLFFWLNLSLLPSRGFAWDVVMLQSFGNHALSHGLASLYSTQDPKSWLPADYPPVLLYFLKLNAWLVQAITGDTTPLTRPYLIISKIFPMLCNLAIGGLLFRHFQAKSRSLALAAAALYLLNPSLGYATSYWGQVDSVHTLLMLASILALIERRFEWSVVAITLAMLTKIQSVVLVPVVAVVLALECEPKRWPRLLLIAAAVVGVVEAPFLLAGPSTALKPYLGAVGRFPYVSMNALNFWALIMPANAGPMIQEATDAARPLGLSLKAVGLGLLATYTLVILRRLLKDRSADAIAFASANLGLAFFVLPTQIHERYLFPAFPFLLLIAASKTRLVWAYLGLSVTYLLNLMMALRFREGNALLGGVQSLLDMAFATLGLKTIVIVSFLNCAIFVWLTVAYLREPAPATERSAGPLGAAGVGAPWDSWLWRAAFYAPLAALSAYTLYHAGIGGLNSWDESRYILNAYEMFKNGDWVALHYGGAVETYPNPKPPLFIWVLAALFHAVGYSERVARFPSLLCGFATAALVYHFLLRLVRDRWTAALAPLGLVTTIGFYGWHAMATADVDTMLALFNTLSFIAIYRVFIEGDTRWYPVLGASLGLGFMTKGAVGLIPIAFAPVAFCLNPKREHLAPRPLAAGVAISLALTVPWLLLRQFRVPDDHLQRMLWRDLLKTGGQPLDGHVGPAWYYLKVALNKLGPWWLLAGLGALLCMVKEWRCDSKGEGRAPALRAATLALCGALAYVALFSCVTTKSSWYIVPAYPLAFLFLGISFSEFMGFIPAWARYGVILAALVPTAVGTYQYTRNTELSTEPAVDDVIFPRKAEFRGDRVILHGDLPQNAFVSARLYSDLRTRSFPAQATLDDMLRDFPEAGLLFTMEAQDFLKGKKASPRLRALKVTPKGERYPGLFQVLSP